MRRVRRWRVGVGLSLLVPASAAGQIVTDGSVGPSLTRTGETVNIAANLGARRGPNLFHSFQEFNVDRGQLVSFTGPADVTRVLARVTGGLPSNINGTLRCGIPGADFYLINPSGVAFGPDAAIDVSGSFVVTSASFVRLADGGRFDATDPGADLLTSAPPAAFGFLGTAAPGAVDVTGEFRDVPVFDDDGNPVLDDDGNPVTESLAFPFLSVPDGKALSVVGGPVRIVGGELRAPAGRLTVVAAGAGAEVALDADNPAAPVALPAGTPREPVNIEGGAFLAADAFADGILSAGSITIQGGEVVVAGGSLVSSVTIEDGGDLLVDGNTIRVTDGAGLLAGTTDAGAGGDVTLRAAEAVFVEFGGQVSTDTTGPGAGGAVRVEAPLLVVDGGAAGEPATGIFAETGLRPGERADLGVDPAFDVGRGGDILLDVGRLEIFSAGTVSATTVHAGQGGTLDVRVDELLIDGVGFTEFTGLAAQSQGSGNGGTLVVTAPRPGQAQPGAGTVDIGRGGGISATAFADGAGGSIMLTANSLLLDGRGAAEIPGPDGPVPVTTGISATSGETGPGRPPRLAGGAGGAITLNVPGTFTIVDATVRTNTNTAAPAGDLVVAAGVLSVERTDPRVQSGIGANVEPGAAGNGGNFTLRAEDLAVSGGGRISVATFGPGNAGDLDLSAGRITLVDGGLIESSSEFLDASPFRGDTLGRGGELTVRSDRDISIRSDARISARAQANDAGSIVIGLPGTLTLDGGQITTEAQLAGGNIFIGTASATPPAGGPAVGAPAVGGPDGNAAGGVAAPGFILLRGGRISANAVQRSGGNVTIRTGNLVADSGSAITATSEQDSPGVIEVAGNVVDLSGSLSRLPGSLTDPTAVLREVCGIRLRMPGSPSSFIVTGRGGAPVGPFGLQPDIPIAGAPRTRR